MKSLEKGQDKIQEICQILRQDTLEPAKREAEEIINAAKQRATEIIALAEKDIEKMKGEAHTAIEQERNVFNSSLEQASRQGLESFRQVIENQLFDKELGSYLETATSDPKVIAQLINTIVQALEKQGLDADLTALIPKNVPAAEVNKLLSAGIAKKLREGGVVLGQFGGGTQIKLHGKKITIDVTDDALKELLLTSS